MVSGPLEGLHQQAVPAVWRGLWARRLHRLLCGECAMLRRVDTLAIVFQVLTFQSTVLFTVKAFVYLSMLIIMLQYPFG